MDYGTGSPVWEYDRGTFSCWHPAVSFKVVRKDIKGIKDVNENSWRETWKWMFLLLLLFFKYTQNILSRIVAPLNKHQLQNISQQQINKPNMIPHLSSYLRVLGRACQCCKNTQNSYSCVKIKACSGHPYTSANWVRNLKAAQQRSVSFSVCIDTLPFLHGEWLQPLCACPVTKCSVFPIYMETDTGNAITVLM